MRERGLKLKLHRQDTVLLGRSREGTWIEIRWTLQYGLPIHGRSRKGAWIEMTAHRRPNN